MSELQSKVAVITGASRGIGAATARELAARGAAVLLAARNAAQIEAIAAEIRSSGGVADAIRCDVCHYSDFAAAVERCREAFGRIDIVVNNAGLIEPIARLADSDPVAWGQVVDANYKGVYHGMRAALPFMLEQGSGVIVNVSSGAATSAMEGWSHYCSSKAAALSLTRCAHREYGELGVRVVGISPGTVATGMQVAIRASGVNPVSQLDPSVHSSPERVARAIAWLCTDDARDYAGIDVSMKDETVQRRAGISS